MFSFCFKYLEPNGYTHPNTDGESRIEYWILDGKPFDQWGEWLALDTYRCLANLLGWETYTETMKIYYATVDEDSSELTYDTKMLNKWVKR